VLYVITGPPTGGKSSWVQAHAKPQDIVIDLDRITVALTGPGAPHWNHDPLQLKVALRARYAAIDEALRHLDQLDVYLIHTMPSAKAMAKYRRLKARIVVCDPGREVVTQRVRDMRHPELQAVVTRWYQRQARRPSQGVMPQASRSW
jgi:predicted kinase